MDPRQTFMSQVLAAPDHTQQRVMAILGQYVSFGTLQAMIAQMFQLPPSLFQEVMTILLQVLNEGKCLFP
jgi:hypothetical protein